MLQGLGVLPRLLAMAVVCLLLPAVAASAQQCGDRDGSGRITAGDALGILKVAVGIATCDVCVCDVNRSGSTNTSDALIVLKKAVGQGVTLNCTSCAVGCNDSAAPECGGECDGSLVCTVSESGDFCGCMTACEISAAPACGGGCEGSGVADAVCTHAHFTLGGQTQDLCLCLPPDAKACGSSGAPQCDGICHPGHLCTQHGNDCECDALALQGPCNEAAAPACGGICAVGQICQAQGESCQCVDSTGDDNACENAADPICGAPCVDGRQCTRDFLGGCRCFDLCELSDAPGCGGSCPDPGQQCSSAAAEIGNSTVSFCECH